MSMFNNDVVLITGASRGIGRATAEAFAAAGACVAINYRADEAGAQATLAAIHAAGGKAILAQADISIPTDVETLVARIEAELGPIEALVNNAAAFNRAGFLDVTLQDLDTVLATNLRGLFYLSQLVARRMAGRGRGAIVNVSSILAQLTVPGRSAYAASKGGVEALTRAMALDLAPYGIRVNAVAPGLVRTEALLAGFRDPALQEAVQRYIPLKRFGEPAELAQAILFLASPAASYITGAILHVDAGLHVAESGPR